MSTTLRGSQLIDNCTVSIQYDRQVQAACQVFDQQMYEIIDDTGQVVFIPNIMGLTDSNLVDILAWQFHVDFYDTTKDLEFRKQLVQLSIVWHKTKGTVDLVNQVLNMFYGPPFYSTAPYIQEWWQYYNPFPPNYPIVSVDEQVATFRPQDVDPLLDKFLIPAAVANDEAVYFKLGDPVNTLPAPLVAGTTYYVVNWTTTEFQVAATVGGAPIDLTSNGSGIINELWNKASGGGNWHDRYRFRVIVDNNVIPTSEVPAIIDLIKYFKPISRWPEGETLQPTASLGSLYVFGWDFLTVTIQSAAATIRTPS
jgi:hypothetical protein